MGSHEDSGDLQEEAIQQNYIWDWVRGSRQALCFLALLPETWRSPSHLLSVTRQRQAETMVIQSVWGKDTAVSADMLHCLTRDGEKGHNSDKAGMVLMAVRTAADACCRSVSRAWQK
jgi:hypothetical protein